jgi:hypothetical protein
MEIEEITDYANIVLKHFPGGVKSTTPQTKKLLIIGGHINLSN